MSKPKRIQRKRTKGWRMPAGVVNVTRSGRYGNSHDWREYRENAPPCLETREEIDHWCKERAVEALREDLKDGTAPVTTDEIKAELRGKDLACWCRPGDPCHADVLLEIANG